MKRDRSTNIPAQQSPKRQRINTTTWGGYFQSLFASLKNLFHSEETTPTMYDEASTQEYETEALDTYEEENTGKTPLHIAVLEGNLEKVIALVNKGALVNIYDNYGFLPIEYTDNNAIKTYLLNNGASIPDRPTLLHYLAQDDDVTGIHELLSNNTSQLNALDFQGETPLFYAIQHGNFDAVMALVEQGANITQVDKMGYPPIFYAETHPEIKAFLLNNGAAEFDPNDRIDLLETELHLAVMLDDYEACERILAENASIINATNRSGELPLTLAVNNQNVAIVELLIKHGADIEHRDHNSNTPLLNAVSLGNQALVDVLLTNGADKETLNDEQLNVIDLAKTDSKHTALSKYLKTKCTLSKTELHEWKKTFEEILKNGVKSAGQQHKMPLLLLGETHGSYKIYQIEKILLQVAKNYGLDTLYAEKPFDEFSITPIEYKANDKLKMSIICVDTHPYRASASVSERNHYISEGISHTYKPGVAIVGSDHLQGLLTDESKIDADNYYLIPFCLRNICNIPHLTSPEADFAANPTNVIQIVRENNAFTASDTVLTKWNSTKQPLLNHFGRPERASKKSQTLKGSKRKAPRL